MTKTFEIQWQYTRTKTFEIRAKDKESALKKLQKQLFAQAIKPVSITEETETSDPLFDIQEKE